MKREIYSSYPKLYLVNVANTLSSFLQRKCIFKISFEIYRIWSPSRQEIINKVVPR